MTTPSRYAVPLESLDGVRVGVEQQVQAEPALVQPYDARLWGGAVGPAQPEGGGGADDGD